MPCHPSVSLTLSPTPPTTAVYIGAGLDVRPVEALGGRLIDRFVYVDSLPRTASPGGHWIERDRPSHAGFVGSFSRALAALGFVRCVDETDDVDEDIPDEVWPADKSSVAVGCRWWFPSPPRRGHSRDGSSPIDFVRPASRGRRKVILRYYVDTAFPADVGPCLAADLRDAEILVVSGHDPDERILELTRSPLAALVRFDCRASPETAPHGKERGVLRRLRSEPQRVLEVVMLERSYISTQCDSLVDLERVGMMRCEPNNAPCMK